MRIQRVRMACAVGALLLGLPLVSPAEADLREKVEELAVQVIRSVPEGKTLRVAVTDLPDLQGVTSDLGRYLAERITTRLAQAGRFTVVERRRLTQVLGELRFGMGDLVDPVKAKRLGQMLGVEALLVGSISDLGNQVDVDVRLIDIESNRMLLGASTTISKDQVVANLIASGRQESFQTIASSSPGRSAVISAAPPSDAKAVSLGGFLFQPRGCRRSGGELICTVTFTNEGNEERDLVVYGEGVIPASRLIDNRGNQYPVVQVIIGRSGSSFMREKFVPQLPVNVHFKTNNVRDDATSMSVVVVIEGFGKTPVLRDVPIASR